MSRSYDICKEIPSKFHPRSLGLDLRLMSHDASFGNQAFFASLCESITLGFEQLVIRNLFCSLGCTKDLVQCYLG
jgi:hypothetical protein